MYKVIQEGFSKKDFVIPASEWDYMRRCAMTIGIPTNYGRVVFMINMSGTRVFDGYGNWWGLNRIDLDRDPGDRDHDRLVSSVVRQTRDIVRTKQLKRDLGYEVQRAVALPIIKPFLVHILYRPDGILYRRSKSHFGLLSTLPKR
jgi:hypothetical protein